MKKIYISPSMQTVQLVHSTIIALSVETNETPLDNNEALVKGNPAITDKSLWDKEW